MYLMSSKYSEYLNLYLYLQIWKSTCTWLKYFEKYLTPTLYHTQQDNYMCRIGIRPNREQILDLSSIWTNSSEIWIEF